MADLFCRSSKDYLKHACMQVHAFVCLSQEFKGPLLLLFDSAFLGGGCNFCIYQQLVMHRLFFNCIEWEQRGLSVSVHGHGHVRACTASLNTRFIRLTLQEQWADRTRSAQMSKFMCNVKVLGVLEACSDSDSICDICDQIIPQCRAPRSSLCTVCRTCFNLLCTACRARYNNLGRVELLFVNVITLTVCASVCSCVP